MRNLPPRVEAVRESFQFPGRQRVICLLWFVAALCCGLPVRLVSQPFVAGASSARSVSGQFLIQGGGGVHRSPITPVLENDTNFVRLDPTLLAVSCERVKQLVWRSLGVTSPWTGKVFLRLYPAQSADSPVLIEADQFRDGWQYRLSLPDLCQRERYVRGIVGVVLLELANREAREHSAEVPLWLSEGMAREIWVSNQREVILASPRFSASGLRMAMLDVSERKKSSLERAHQQLCSETPLTFQQLSWPKNDPVTGEPPELYRNSAQVFVHQLLQLPSGADCLRTMVQNLFRYYNWQFAFHQAFQTQFREAVDVEKWWSLQLVHFTGRELVETWNPDNSWEKLDQLIRSAVQIRVGTNELPLHTEIPLQTIIRDWPAYRQSEALGNKTRELRALQPRLSRDLAAIVDDYCATLNLYLERLVHPGFVLPFRKQAVRHLNADEAIQRLDVLDEKRKALRPSIASDTVVQAP